MNTSFLPIKTRSNKNTLKGPQKKKKKKRFINYSQNIIDDGRAS